MLLLLLTTRNKYLLLISFACRESILVGWILWEILFWLSKSRVFSTVDSFIERAELAIKYFQLDEADRGSRFFKRNSLQFTAHECLKKERQNFVALLFQDTVLEKTASKIQKWQMTDEARAEASFSQKEIR